MGILDRIAGRLDELVGGEGDTQTPAGWDVGQARALVERGRLEEAVVAFGDAVDRDAGNADAWMGLGETLARLDRFEPARDALRRALTLPLAPAIRPRAQAALGRLYAQAGQTGKAIRELRKAVAALPTDVETLTALGRALLAAGASEGSEWLASAARIPASGLASLLVEAAGATKGDPNGAERLLREARERAPHDVAVHAALIRHLIAQQRVTEAVSEALDLAQRSPTDPVAWGVLREGHAAAGDFRAALEDARREAAVGPPPPFAVWLTLAFGSEDRAAVEEAVRHGTPLDPKFAEARALLDGTLNDLGVAALARVAPPGQPRRFVVRALAPPPVPAGNIYALLSWAEAFAARHAALLPLAVPMARAVEAFDRPLLVAVMGEFNAGKSSFVNALAGAAIAPVGITPTTATVNVLRHGASGGRVIYHDGRARELAASAVTDFLARLADADAALIRQVELFAPVEALRRVEIVDTPGLNSLRAAHEQVARDFLIEADAIVWVFAAGQAAKATEHAALVVADGAGKHVLGVVNKVDRATPSEIAEILGHVRAELGGLVERVLPLSARAALEARRRGDTAALDGSGLTAVEAALESDFFGRARELKRGTALTTLARFVSQARAAIDAAPVEDGSFARIRSAIGGGEQELRSALAAERLALRVRLEAAFRAVAPEVREFIRPRAWLFGEHRADPEDEIFLRDLLDDGALAATERTRATLKAAVPDAEPAVMGLLSDLGVGIDDAVERFRAYVRGIVEGAAAVFFRVDLPRIRLDLTAIRGALGRWSPDPEESLFGPVERLIDTFAARAYSDLDERQQRAEIAALMRREHVLEPLARLADAIAALVGDAAGEPSA